MSISTWYAVLTLTHPTAAWIVETMIAVLVLLIAATVANVAARSAPAAVRHIIWCAALFGSVVLPAVRGVGLGLAGDNLQSWIGQDPSTGPWWFAVATWLWCTGTLALLTRMTIGQWRLRQVLRGSQPLTHPAWTAQFPRDLRDRVRLITSDEIASPVAVGLWTPTVAIPTSMIDATPFEIRSILLHELTHIRRKDVLTTHIGLWARALYWPLPPAWMAVRGLRLESEKACDSSVISAGVNGLAYARQLMRMAGPGPVALHGAVAPALGRSELYRRVDAICRRQAPRSATRLALAVTAIAAAGTFLAVSKLELPRAELGFVSSPASEVFVGTGPR